jgi:hypothetical protein
MLQKYKAISLEKNKVVGGTTLPCIMRLEGEPSSVYVVKVFKQRHIEQYNPTNKEILGNRIAKMFDLNVPKMGIVEVNKGIIEELKKDESYAQLELKAGLYFGCEYLEDTCDYNSDIEYDIYDMEKIFAFDALIHNFDRRINKPNILFKDDNFILIDHDLSLDIQNNYEDYKNGDRYSNIVNGGKGEHIFLQRLRKESEEITFDEFIENLRRLDFNKLKQLKNEMNEFGLKTADMDNIILYLKAVQQDAADFQKLLNNLLK